MLGFSVFQEFLRDIFNLLFLLPSLKDRQQPKCKSHSSRAAAYDLLVEMVKGSVENYRLIHNWVMAQHMQCKHSCFSLIFLNFVCRNEIFEGHISKKEITVHTL